MLAVTALTVAVALNVGFLRFCPKSCLSGHDNKADVSAIDLIGCLIAAREGQFFSTSRDILRPLLPERVRS